MEVKMNGKSSRANQRNFRYKSSEMYEMWKMFRNLPFL